MGAQLLASFALYAFVASITPGPNNMMLMSSGLTFGFARTIPHMLGVALGFVLMVFLVGVGLGALFEALPQLYLALQAVSIAYLLYLAWKIANAGPVGEGGGVSGEPMTFLGAAAFQWINPKAWVMAVNAVAVYAPRDDFLRNVAIVCLVFGAINLPSVACWAAFGDLLRRVMRDPRRMRAINIGMALALVASLYPIAVELLAAWPGS